MSVALFDVNVLVALFDDSHPHHDEAHRWLGRNQMHGWATCPITVNGCIRILTNPAYPGGSVSLGTITDNLRVACSSADHHFWQDSVSLFDQSLFETSKFGGHKKLTDAYLLGLAVRNHGKLITFDRGISLKAVPAAGLRHLVLLGST